MTREMWEGNQAIAEAAVRAGLEAYFGYPITPQTEALEYLSKRMPELGRTFVQAESELGAINMVYGAACAGVRVMSTSSSPGVSLMQEGISYIASAELPCLVVNVNRGGPGLGTIQPSQGDYFQATKGGGHGDYRLIVLAPASVQEMADFVFDAFDLADRYRNPVMILADGALGQMMEKVTFRDYDVAAHAVPKPWATTGKTPDRERNVIITGTDFTPPAPAAVPLAMQEFAPDGAVSGVTSSIPALEKAARRVAQINVLPDSDGVIRWTRLAIPHDGKFYPSLGLSGATERMGADGFEVGPRYLRIGERKIPTDGEQIPNDFVTSTVSSRWMACQGLFVTQCLVRSSSARTAAGLLMLPVTAMRPAW